MKEGVASEPRTYLGLAAMTLRFPVKIVNSDSTRGAGAASRLNHSDAPARVAASSWLALKVAGVKIIEVTGKPGPLTVHCSSHFSRPRISLFQVNGHL